MHGRRAGSLAGEILAEHEGHENETDRHPRELHVDVLISLDLRLLIQLVVDGCQSQSAAVGAAKAATEESGERLTMLHKGV